MAKRQRRQNGVNRAKAAARYGEKRHGAACEKHNIKQKQSIAQNRENRGISMAKMAASGSAKMAGGASRK